MFIPLSQKQKDLQKRLASEHRMSPPSSITLGMMSSFKFLISVFIFFVNSPGIISILEGRFKKPTEAKASAFVSAYFDDIPEEAFQNVIDTNAVGPYWLTFAFLPLLEQWKEHGFSNGSRRFHPQVVMTSSMNGWTKVCSPTS